VGVLTLLSLNTTEELMIQSLYSQPEASLSEMEAILTMSLSKKGDASVVAIVAACGITVAHPGSFEPILD